MPKGDGTGPLGRGPGVGPGRGRGARTGGPGKCVCPSCGYEEVHVRGTPCAQKTCPKCGVRLVGKF